MTRYETHNTNHLTVNIYPDQDPINPREDFDHAGTMVCWHRRYKLGDEQPDMDPEEWFEDIFPPDAIVMPLFLYDHSGITMSTAPFSCPWDSGQVGWIYVPMDKARQEFTGTDEEIRAAAERCLRAEVEEYDRYLAGDAWGYSLEDGDGNILDSCWGFFGLEYARAEALAAASAYTFYGAVPCATSA